MTPDLGQGVNQALEDISTLAAVLDVHPTRPAALPVYYYRECARARR
jgi:2-polyprenyl-6-methoxyphenol hydroxylase-like FAD-dependent oxidoreductase